jgi:ribosomal protein L37AE/L43A
MPHCIECHAEYDARRKALGYKTCLDCGEATARAVKHCTVPGHKQGYFVVGNREELKVLNPKRVGW